MMEAGSEPVTCLEQSLANFYSLLDQVLVEVEAIEDEASSVIEKLHDHLEQASICQRYLHFFRDSSIN